MIENPQHRRQLYALIKEGWVEAEAQYTAYLDDYTQSYEKEGRLRVWVAVPAILTVFSTTVVAQVESFRSNELLALIPIASAFVTGLIPIIQNLMGLSVDPRRHLERANNFNAVRRDLESKWGALEDYNDFKSADIDIRHITTRHIDIRHSRDLVDETKRAETRFEKSTIALSTDESVPDFQNQFDAPGVDADDIPTENVSEEMPPFIAVTRRAPEMP